MNLPLLCLEEAIFSNSLLIRIFWQGLILDSVPLVRITNVIVIFSSFTLIMTLIYLYRRIFYKYNHIKFYYYIIKSFYY